MNQLHCFVRLPQSVKRYREYTREIRHVYVSRRILLVDLLSTALMRTNSSLEATYIGKCGQKHGWKKVASLLMSVFGISRVFPILFEVWISEQYCLLVILKLLMGQHHFYYFVFLLFYFTLVLFSSHCFLHTLWKTLLKTCSWVTSVIYTLK